MAKPKSDGTRKNGKNGSANRAAPATSSAKPTARTKSAGAKPAKAAVAPAPARRTQAKPRPAPKSSAPAPTTAAPARKPAAKAAAPRKRATPKNAAPVLEPPLTEEERIEAAKYLPRDLPKRLFEEERFVFPESYGVTRVRLLVKDPEWLFAHWDVDPKTLASLKGEVGERAMALSRLTLRIADPDQGGQKTILLPPGARSWYVRADARRARVYMAELGVTLPSGEFRALAESNKVATPRVGPSPEVARERKRVGPPPESAGADTRASAGAASGAARARTVKAEPWRPSPEHVDAAPGGKGGSASEGKAPAETARGGASDAFRTAGASDVHRR